MPLRIVYVSTLADGVGPQDLDAIVAHSARANPGRGITGLLALEDGRVCQVLEGPDADVGRLFDTIERDPRHRDVVVLDRRTVEAPHFGRWGMARRRMIDIVSLALTVD